jgi:hypothetical protein
LQSADYDRRRATPFVLLRGLKMPRRRKSRIWPLALSPDRAAEHLCVRKSRVRKAIASKELEAFVSEGNRVIVLTEHLIAWVKTWPRADRLASYQKLRNRSIQQKEPQS